MAIMKIDELYAATCTGEKRAESQLFERLSVRFSMIAHLKIGNREDAEDVVQDALSAIAREYRSMEFRSFRAWAYKVFDNRLLNYIGGKMRKNKNTVPILVENQLITGNSNPDFDLKIRLRECLGKIRAINTRYARILNLHYQGFPADDICGKLGVTKENLYMILSRARSTLNRCLETGEVKP
jgi:RNA polymerase sigma factor (sigma-70 family)